jgi:hypothetical protein
MNISTWLLLLAISPFPANSAQSSSNSAVAVIRQRCWEYHGEAKVSPLDLRFLERHKATEERRQTRSDRMLVVSCSDGGLESGTAPMPLSPPGRPIAEVHTTILDDGAVLINTESKLCYRLDRWATFIWLRLSKGTPLAEIAHEIAGSHGDLATTVSVVESLHGKFVQAGLLRTGDPEPKCEP